MKEYLEERIKQLQIEYNEMLIRIGQTVGEYEYKKEKKRVEWEFIEDRKSRIDECRLCLDVFKENNYKEP